ncbi:MAG: MerR family transcriptional regulator [Acidimicrobiaceae bacterium]|nr:MerR family transcriptional regulator [Acidimicrobiaceae bacterium]MYK75061.1 MerR family transcriptional regulator [Acidimicrobiaceae bacterium]
MSRAYRSIGEVLSLLADEHPDLTISKIRFLESQGLIAPQRTPSGYRKFFEADIERLNWVLIQQRDHFLPLKEIKRRLASGAAARAAPRAGAGAEAIAATPSLFTARSRAGADADAAAAARAAPDGSVGLTADGLARAVGIDAAHIAELQRLGVIVPVAERADGDGEAEPVFDHDALLAARTATALADHGIPARNLRMFKVAADREAGVYEQLLGPLIARGERDRLRAELAEIVELTEQLRRLLLQRTLRAHLDPEAERARSDS